MEKLHQGWKASFFTIWTGQQLSLVGSRAAQFALVWWLTTTTGSATILASATMVALIPQILLGPFVGAFVDRWNRRSVLIVADSAIALVSLWLAYLFWSGSMQVWHVYVVMLARSLGEGFHWPAMAASTTMMVPKAHLSRVAGLNQAMNGALAIIGPPAGALLLSVLPLHGVMLIDVGTALFAVVPLLFIAIPQPRRALSSQQGGEKPSIWADVLWGFRYIRSWRGLTVLIAAAMVIKIALTPAFSLLPLLVRGHFGGEATHLGLLEALAGVGMLVGGLTLSAWGGFRRRILTVLVGVGGLGAALIWLGFTPATAFWMALAAMTVVGLVIPMIDGPIMAILQAAVAPEMQGRVFSVMNSLLLITSPLGLAAAGPVSDWIGLQVWYVTAGVLCAAVVLVGCFIPTLLHIEENAQEDRVPAGGVQAADPAAVPAERPHEGIV